MGSAGYSSLPCEICNVSLHRTTDMARWQVSHQPVRPAARHLLSRATAAADVEGENKSGVRFGENCGLSPGLTLDDDRACTTPGWPIDDLPTNGDARGAGQVQ